MGESEGGPLTLHVEGLTRSVGAVHLADIFSTYGEVSKCSVEKDKRTGLSKVRDPFLALFFFLMFLSANHPKFVSSALGIWICGIH